MVIVEQVCLCAIYCSLNELGGTYFVFFLTTNVMAIFFTLLILKNIQVRP